MFMPASGALRHSVCRRFLRAPYRPTAPTLHQASTPAVYNDTSSADVQLRILDREFRAGWIGIDEYRQMKKVLTGE